MDTALWIAQGVLAAVFLAAGITKLIRSREKLAETQGWVEDFSGGNVKLIGVVEVAGALGLILPGATGIAPILVPLAASGLALEQICAAVVHLRRGESSNIVANLILIALALFIAWGRFGAYPL
jgi:uncharacterized membrane protein YphA (DoxX/SURF4 family)